VRRETCNLPYTLSLRAPRAPRLPPVVNFRVEAQRIRHAQHDHLAAGDLPRLAATPCGRGTSRSDPGQCGAAHAARYGAARTPMMAWARDRPRQATCQVATCRIRPEVVNRVRNDCRSCTCATGRDRVFCDAPHRGSRSRSRHSANNSPRRPSETCSGGNCSRIVHGRFRSPVGNRPNHLDPRRASWRGTEWAIACHHGGIQ
jgi:hypothetical protein